MQFRIGTRAYLVKRQWNLALEGKPVDGLCSASLRAIWLDGELTPETIVGVLRHEHKHAWEFEVGSPCTSEDEANFFSTVSEAFEYEFEQQEGLKALMMLPIEGTNPGTTRPAQQASPIGPIDHVYCGACGDPIMDGSIDRDEPEFIDSLNLHLVSSGCKCPTCGEIQTWKQRCTPEGIPLGEFYGAKILRGPAADKWINERKTVYNAA